MHLNDTTVLSEWVNTRVIAPTPHARELAAPDERRWVNWRFEERNGKRTKVPCMPSGRSASSTDPNTWSTLDEVEAAKDDFDGIGFVFAGDTLGIDIDHCIVDGSIQPEVEAVVREARSYTEVSPSGTGLHIFLRLASPLVLERNRSGSYECYVKDRFFTVTGASWRESYPLRTVTPEEALDVLRLLGYPWSSKTATNTEAQTATPTTLEDAEVLSRMFASKNGEKIRALYNGDTSDHGNDDSTADAALCAHFAFFTGRSVEQMERLWLSSPLGSRAKTQSRKDYRNKTIKFAAENCKEVYMPPIDNGLPPFVLGISPVNPTTELPSTAMEFISDTDLLTMSIPPVEWQIEHLFAKGSLNMISAPPNQFKSMIALRMAMSVAHGRPLFGEFEVDKTNVLFVEEEDTIAMLKERYSMLLENGEEGGGVYFAVDTGRKIDPQWAQEIVYQAQARDAKFVILDSLRALHAASENDSDQMQPVMDTLKRITRTGITLLYTHHHRKGMQGFNNEQSESGMDAARGSSAITAAVHGHITCQEKKGGDHYLVIHQTKLKADRKLDPFKVRIGSLLEPKKLSFTYAGLYDADMAAIDAMSAKLMDHFRENKEGVYTRKQLVALKFSKSPEDRTLRDALARLVDEEKLLGIAFKELSDTDKTKKQGKAPSANATVYKYLSDTGTALEEDSSDF